MKSLQYVFSAILLFFLAYVLSVVLLVTGSVIYTIILVAICVFLVALLVCRYSIVKSLIIKLLGRRNLYDLYDLETGEKYQSQPPQRDDLDREFYWDIREDKCWSS